MDDGFILIITVWEKISPNCKHMKILWICPFYIEAFHSPMFQMLFALYYRTTCRTTEN